MINNFIANVNINFFGNNWNNHIIDENKLTNFKKEEQQKKALIIEIYDLKNQILKKNNFEHTNDFYEGLSVDTFKELNHLIEIYDLKNLIQANDLYVQANELYEGLSVATLEELNHLLEVKEKFFKPSFTLQDKTDAISLFLKIHSSEWDQINNLLSSYFDEKFCVGSFLTVLDKLVQINNGLARENIIRLALRKAKNKTPIEKSTLLLGEANRFLDTLPYIIIQSFSEVKHIYDQKEIQAHILSGKEFTLPNFFQIQKSQYLNNQSKLNIL